MLRHRDLLTPTCFRRQVDFSASIDDSLLEGLSIEKGGRKLITHEERGQVLGLLDGESYKCNAGGERGPHNRVGLRCLEVCFRFQHHGGGRLPRPGADRSGRLNSLCREPLEYAGGGLEARGVSGALEGAPGWPRGQRWERCAGRILQVKDATCRRVVRQPANHRRCAACVASYGHMSLILLAGAPPPLRPLTAPPTPLPQAPLAPSWS